MIGNALNQLFIGVWSLLNLGIEIDGFYLKFWYLPALYLLIKMVLILIGFDGTNSVKEKSGASSNYKSKRSVDND